MNTQEAIAARRSIREYEDRPIPAEHLEVILEAAMQAPSGKNLQPWRFIVVSGDKRAEMVEAMRQGIAHAESLGIHLGSSKGSAGIMEEAPATVFVFNPYGLHPWESHSMEQQMVAMTNLQSVGASIQNMTLAALDLGLGSLWICDVYYAYRELSAWLGEEGQLVAAVALGYPAESPSPRPRKPFDEVVRRM